MNVNAVAITQAMFGLMYSEFNVFCK